MQWEADLKDQSIVTGWGEGNGDTIPKYHNQYAMFRGFVYFDCDEASKLPWNTTKTGLDVDSAIYQAVRLQMITMMRPVIDFLNALDREKDTDRNDLKRSSRTRNRRHCLVLPSPRSSSGKNKAASRRSPTLRICYSKPRSSVERAQRQLNVTIYHKEVGERPSDYYFKLECED